MPQASDVHRPYPGAHPAEPVVRPPGSGGAGGFSGLPGALIAFGCAVFALAAAAIAYLCFVRRRIRDSEEEGGNTKTIVIPRYEPVFVEPNFKEYETQVLQMSVPPADDYYPTTQQQQQQQQQQQLRRLRPDAADSGGGGGGFNLDSISYITKDRLSHQGGGDSPGAGGLSDWARMTGAGTGAGMGAGDLATTAPAPRGHGGEVGDGGRQRQHHHYSTLPGEEAGTPIRNPLFHR